MLLIALCIIISSVLLPETAHAWGGGIHLQTGLNVLAALDTLPPGIAAILAAYPRDYLYGCVAADIIVGKKHTHYLLNCHRWGIGQKVLQTARTDGEKACAYGYLSHLAADCIAHNYFVPYKIMLSFTSVALKHTYWEMRFETCADKVVWEQAREICRSDQQANDAMLRSVLSNTIFSFGTNKRIFNSILLLSRLEKWQKVLHTLSNNSRYPLAEQDRDDYLGLTGEAVFDFLRHPQEAHCLFMDPTGEKPLAIANVIRKNLRLLYRNGRISRGDGMEQVELLKDKLRRSLRNPELLKELHSGRL